MANENQVLTKRELIAAMALQGLLSVHGENVGVERATERAVEFADALVSKLSE